MGYGLGQTSHSDRLLPLGEGRSEGRDFLGQIGRSFGDQNPVGRLLLPLNFCWSIKLFLVTAQEIVRRSPPTPLPEEEGSFTPSASVYICILVLCVY
jgi:hypothetical protein